MKYNLITLDLFLCASKYKSLVKAAKEKHLVVSAVSKRILDLEKSVGVNLFYRRKTGVELTLAGLEMQKHCTEIFNSINKMDEIIKEYSLVSSGTVRVTANLSSITQFLPEDLATFSKKYPKINLNIHQGNPSQVTDQIIKGEADVGIATESISLNENIFTIPCYHWNRCVVMPKDHPLTRIKHISLETLASFPMITYDYAFTGSTIVSEVFKNANIEPKVMLTAIDADVIKTYVSLNMGIGLIAEMAYDPANDLPLVSRDVSHLFPLSTTYIGIRRDNFLRKFTSDFIQLFIPQISEKELKKTLNTRHLKS